MLNRKFFRGYLLGLLAILFGAALTVVGGYVVDRMQEKETQSDDN